MTSALKIAQDISADLLGLKDKLTDKEYTSLQEKLCSLSKSDKTYVRVTFCHICVEANECKEEWG